MGKIEKIKAPESEAATKRMARKARRMEAIAKASTVTFTLEPAVQRFMSAQAKAADMNMTHYMQMLVETHVIATADQNDPLAVRLAAKRFVINHAVTLAGEMDAAGKFEEDFILKVVQEAQTSAEFTEQYALALGGKEAEGTRAAKRAAVSLNQQIGRVIKKAAGARSKRNERGRIARATVQDAIISTYTLLEKPS
ncbi:hypothetical protein Z945_1418 [Sulfitobacter noctilucae]|uniref:hypothetical protein n=1 Tax=Sulfitobacter noctilucae TaxID=1342302 RepID=UPI000467F7B4|nr:hypothetical protein [Sulfitobacter noctilucae]KIN60446.1 hypothetical protein Z945_1418 [Sulfitobacter noctilucae]